MANASCKNLVKARKAKVIWQSKYKSGNSPKLDVLARLSGKTLFYINHGIPV